MIIRNQKIEIEPTPHELANCFCDLCDDEQAAFFNHIFTQTEKWEHPFCFQLQSVTDSQILNAGGRSIMEQIGQYSPLYGGLK